MTKKGSSNLSLIDHCKWPRSRRGVGEIMTDQVPNLERPLFLSLHPELMSCAGRMDENEMMNDCQSTTKMNKTKTEYPPACAVDDPVSCPDNIYGLDNIYPSR
jgi:hypothetical protein